MLTVIGNLRIDTLSRLDHLKTSFASFNTTSDDWLINIRGTFKEDALDFLKEKLGEKMTVFNLSDNDGSWINNSLKMLERAKFDYVLVWNEDHLNIANQQALRDVVVEMKNNDVDYLLYSWWMFGKARKVLDDISNRIKLVDSANISWLDLDKDKWLNIRENGYPYFIISMCGIFKKSFLSNMWAEDANRLPLFLKKIIFKIFGLLTKFGFSKTGHKELFDKINRLFFFNKIRKYPKETPFEMEKNPERLDILPIRWAVPKQEIFACIDDNIKEQGYSLIERGLYKNSNNIIDINSHINNILLEIKITLSKINQVQVDTLVQSILSSKKIIASGAGRVGMAVRGFVMRLKHLGLDAYMIGDANVPALNQDDLFLVCSGSGETQTIFELVSIANRNQSRVALITGNPNSRMGKLADVILEIKAPSKVKKVEGFTSIQPMTTLNEQCISLFFDALVLRLMQELGETHETMWARHSNLE